VLSLRSFRILLTPLTYIPVGEAHHFAIDALRRLSTSYDGIYLSVYFRGNKIYLYKV
jgi:hypothetical protein